MIFQLTLAEDADSFTVTMVYIEDVTVERFDTEGEAIDYMRQKTASLEPYDATKA